MISCVAAEVPVNIPRTDTAVPSHTTTIGASSNG